MTSQQWIGTALVAASTVIMILRSKPDPSRGEGTSEQASAELGGRKPQPMGLFIATLVGLAGLALLLVPYLS